VELQGGQVRVVLAEVNGRPRLMCMTRLNSLDLDSAGHGGADADVPADQDLVTDVSWNFKVKEGHQEDHAAEADAPDGTYRVAQRDVDRVQEFRKCIECFLCQDVCHVLREHAKFDEFIGPRFFVYAAQLEMNPIDAADRVPDMKDKAGIGYCNITKCCTKVCPSTSTSPTTPSFR
jgi:succinate dehydrogenase / fumarate reductase iron-sulfur subunit